MIWPQKLSQGHQALPQALLQSCPMHAKLSPSTIMLLTLPPIFWAGNAVVGRLVAPLASPMTLNLLRWAIAFVLLLPLAAPVLRRGSSLWPSWQRFAVLGLLSIGGYNALLYLALNTSTPINVTLVGASTPVWMLLMGRVFFGIRISGKQWLGALMSISGVSTTEQIISARPSMSE